MFSSIYRHRLALLCRAVRTHDIYNDFADVVGELDTSNFETD